MNETTVRLRERVAHDLFAADAHQDRRAGDHNRTVNAWSRGASVGLHERGILDLIAGAVSWIDAHPTDPDNYDDDAERPAVDPFAAEFIVGPILAAIHTALNYETGALMGGPLSAFVSRLAKSCEVDS